MTENRVLLSAALVAVAAGIVTVAAPAAIAAAIDPAAHPFQDTCALGTKLDNTTREQTVTKIVDAGYFGISDVVKGCDNWWHAEATHSGQDVAVLVSPDGRVLVD